MSHFEDILKRSLEIHETKRKDYTTNPDTDPYENFKRSNEIGSWFPNFHKSFAILIGTKLARLASLLSTGRKPSNESLDDTFLDLVTYCALWYEYWKSKFYEPIMPDAKEWLENRKELERKTNWSVMCKTCKLPIEPNSILYLDKQYYAHHKRCDQMADLRIP